ncbi:aromatic-ring-hydroxylating dioxygenase subunit beta [Saccharopolyspora sp. 5N102]|uniref:aromatic-ring-hydroxylating dioxygenase subunit beta n=1 Tax=Saccharopolyspora sp. 5N102 TaxID=3375155 RepID=UPI0037A3FC66
MSEIEDFLHAEAALLDARDFPGWLKLFAPDGIYWIPAIADDIDPRREVSIVYDNMQHLAERVWRLDSGLAYAQEPTSRTAHLVGNIRIIADDGDELDVESSFLVAEYRAGVQHVHAGQYRHRLRRAGGELQIVRKKVELINNDGQLGNLSLLL